MNITDKTKGLIIIGNKLYKLNSEELSQLNHHIDSGATYTIGNKFKISYDSLEDFLTYIEENHTPIVNIYGIYGI